MNLSDQIKNLIRNGKKDGYILEDNLSECISSLPPVDQDYIRNTIDGFKIQVVKSIDDYDEIILIGSGKGVTSVSKINDLKWKRRKTGCYTKLNKIYNSLV